MPYRTDEIRLKARLATGLSIGIGLTVVNGVLLFGFTSTLAVGEKLLGTALSALAAVPVSLCTTNLFFSLFSSPSLNRWASVPLGALAGLAEGALIGGATYGLFFAVMEVVNPAFARFDGVVREALRGFAGGAAFGAMIGVVPGAVAGLLIRTFLPRSLSSR